MVGVVPKLGVLLWQKAPKEPVFCISSWPEWICLDFGIILASFKFIQTLEIYAHINICQIQETIKAGTELFLLSLLFKAGNCAGQIIKTLIKATSPAFLRLLNCTRTWPHNPLHSPLSILHSSCRRSHSTRKSQCEDLFGLVRQQDQVFVQWESTVADLSLTGKGSIMRAKLVVTY